MKQPPFAAIKFSVTLVLAALLLAGAGTLLSGLQAQHAEAALQQQADQLRAARQQLDNSHHQKQLIARHLADYQALAARGFMGPEDRLAWVEAAQIANREARLYGLGYRLAPRAPSPASLAEGLPLGQTTMTLTLPLLVETDLERFLAALKSRAPGVVRVQGCRLSQSVASAPESVAQPRLQAVCTLQWFTLTNAEGGTS